MKRNLKTLAIIFSVVLNIVFVGSYLYYRLVPAASATRQRSRIPVLYEQLNLNRKQLQKLIPLRDSFHAFVNEQGIKMKAKQLELINLLAKDNPDRLAIKAKQQEIQALQRQMQARVIDHLLKESKVFTPEQRHKFFALMKDRIEKSSGPRPRWMPQRAGNPPKGNCP